MDAIEALRTRRSVRAYQGDAVSRKIIEDIVDCGRLAPSANNVQSWEFVVVADPGMRGKIAAATDFGGFIAQAPVCVAVLSRDTKYYLEDGSAATENILLAARAHGLGSCWVAGDKKPYAAEICRLLGAPPGSKLVSLISIGFPADNWEPRKRPLSEVLHWEKY
ncbi:MAG: nitroreductase family protein [Terriglobia bacterium]